MVEPRKSQLIDMTLKDEDLLKTDFDQSPSPERLISILSSPDITDFNLKCDCAAKLLKICSQNLRYEETLLRILMNVQDALKTTSKDEII